MGRRRNDFAAGLDPQPEAAGKMPRSLLHLWIFLHIYAKKSRFMGSFGSLHGINIHIREYL
jgi:hypothetical protein